MVFCVLGLWGQLGFTLSTNFQTNFFRLAVLALAVYHAAFVCEALRSGVNTVPVGQAEAARAIGLGVLAGRAARHPAAGVPRLRRAARQRAHRAHQELDRRGGRGRRRGVRADEDDDRVPARRHRRDLPHVRPRLRHHRRARSAWRPPRCPDDWRWPDEHPVRRPRARVARRRMVWVEHRRDRRRRRASASGSCAGSGAKGQLDPALWKPFLTASPWDELPAPRACVDTLKAAGISIVTAAVFGLVFGLGRLSGSRAVRSVSRRDRRVLPRRPRAAHDDLLLPRPRRSCGSSSRPTCRWSPSSWG